MGLLNQLKQINNVQTQLQSQLNRALYKFIGTGTPIMDDSNRETFISKGYGYNPDVYAVINKITKRLAGIKPVLYKVTNEREAKKFLSLKHSVQVENKLYQRKAMKEIDSHYILDVLEKPNPLQSYQEFIENTAGFYMATGETFLFGDSPDGGPDKGAIIRMSNLPPQHMDIIAHAQNIVGGYRLKYGQVEDTFQPEQVCHIKMWNPFFDQSGSQLRGMSPLKAMWLAVQQSNTAALAAVKSLQNMGPGGILTSEDDQGLTGPQASEIENKFRQKYTGPSGQRIIVTGAKLKWYQIGLSPVDLEIFNSRLFSLIDICNAYGLPSEMMNNGKNKTYNSMKEARQAMITDAVLPVLDAIFGGLNRWMVPTHQKNGEKLYLGYDINLIPELQADMEKLVQQLAAAWWLTGNEKREAMGYDDDPELDKYFIPSNILPLGDEEQFDDDEATAEAAKRVGDALREEEAKRRRIS